MNDTLTSTSTHNKMYVCMCVLCNECRARISPTSPLCSPRRSTAPSPCPPHSPEDSPMRWTTSPTQPFRTAGSCLHTYIHTYIHICIQTRIHTFLYSFEQRYLHFATCPCLYVFIYVRTYIHTCRWAGLKAEFNDKFSDLKYGYGYMRAPWSMNPSPYISRFAKDSSRYVFMYVYGLVKIIR